MFGYMIFAQQVDLKDSNLPIVLINTNGATIPKDIKLNATMKIIDNGKGKRNYITDIANNYDGQIGIELRGQTSADLSPKKPYALELRDSLGNDRDTKILGMPSESDWALIAPYSDKSLIRDALAYTIAAQLMEYAPRFRFCELVLNGQYQGIYMMTEKIKRNKNRVNIDKLLSEDTQGDELTGGYIFKWDKGAPGEYRIYSKYKTGSRSHEFFLTYPKADDIKAEQKSYLENYIYDFEKSLYGKDFRDPKIGFRKYIDQKSFVDFYIVNELAHNVDGLRLSTYYYKDKNSKNDKLKAGPAWDFNLAFGNCNYCGHDLWIGWTRDFNKRCPDDYWLQPFWWNRLIEDVDFANSVAVRWEKLRKDTLSDARLIAHIDELEAQLSEAQQRNFKKWPILGTWVWPNAKVGATYTSEVNALRFWVGDRAFWLDNNMLSLKKPLLDAEKLIEVKVYPNPAHDEVNFDFYTTEAEKVNIIIYDIAGREVQRLQDTQNKSGIHNLQWANITQPGTYFYVIEQEGTASTQGKLLIIQ